MHCSTSETVIMLSAPENAHISTILHLFGLMIIFAQNRLSRIWPVQEKGKHKLTGRFVYNVLRDKFSDYYKVV